MEKEIMQKNLSIINTIKGELPSLSFIEIKNDILGKNYSLSVAYVDEKKSREINKKYRKKNKPTNVLSFSLHQNEGELVLCPAVIKREAKSFNKTFRQFLGFLVIHGMLHLKGMRHGSIMEKAENFYCKKYDKKYFSGHRRRISNYKSRSGRILNGRKIFRNKNKTRIYFGRRCKFTRRIQFWFSNYF